MRQRCATLDLMNLAWCLSARTLQFLYDSVCFRVSRSAQFYSYLHLFAVGESCSTFAPV
jgi:hypothetical protein